jgi:hypothetical protein
MKFIPYQLLSRPRAHHRPSVVVEISPPAVSADELWRPRQS